MALSPKPVDRPAPDKKPASERAQTGAKQGKELASGQPACIRGIYEVDDATCGSSSHDTFTPPDTPSIAALRDAVALSRQTGAWQTVAEHPQRRVSVFKDIFRFTFTTLGALYLGPLPGLALAVYDALKGERSMAEGVLSIAVGTLASSVADLPGKMAIATTTPVNHAHTLCGAVDPAASVAKQHAALAGWLDAHLEARICAQEVVMQEVLAQGGEAAVRSYFGVRAQTVGRPEDLEQDGALTEDNAS
jgi:hypothetical protein